MKGYTFKDILRVLVKFSLNLISFDPIWGMKN